MGCVNGLVRLVSLCSVLLICSAADLRADRVQELIKQCYNLDPSAGELIDELIDHSREHPRGYFLKAARLYWLQYYAEYDSDLSEEFEEVAKEALVVAKRYYAEHKVDDEDALFFWGMLELNLARYYVDHGHWWSAFFKARSGMKHLQRLLRVNPDYHDAKQPFGLANCYLDDVPAYLKVFARLVRFEGDYDKGMSLLKESKRLGYYTRFESSIYIADVSWGVRKDAVVARSEMEDLVTQFPHNVFFQYKLAVLEEKMGELDGAIERLERVVEMRPLSEFFGLHVEAWLKLGYFQNMAGASDSALISIDRALKLLNEGIEVKRLRAVALFLKANVLRGKGQKEQALGLLKTIERSWHPQLYKDVSKKIKEIESS